MEEKNKIVNILAIQMESLIGKLDSNIDHTRHLIQEPLKLINDVDIIVLPEVWTCGWDCDSFPDCAEVLQKAKSVKMLKRIAKRHNVNIIGGSIIRKKQNGKFANCCPVINRKGKIICTYEKTHLYSYYGDNESDYIEAGRGPVMVDLDGVKVGLSICYDIRFPELYRAYRKAGADILINMAAWGYTKKAAWDSMTTARAVENQTYFVALTQTGYLKNDNMNLGHSMIIDYQGNYMDEIDKKEGYIYASLDLEEMYKYREKCTVLKDLRKIYKVRTK